MTDSNGAAHFFGAPDTPIEGWVVQPFRFGTVVSGHDIDVFVALPVAQQGTLDAAHVFVWQFPDDGEIIVGIAGIRVAYKAWAAIPALEMFSGSAEATFYGTEAACLPFTRVPEDAF